MSAHEYFRVLRSQVSTRERSLALAFDIANEGSHLHARARTLKSLRWAIRKAVGRVS